MKTDKSKKVGSCKKSKGPMATKSSVRSTGRMFPKGNNTYHRRRNLCG